jgi:hypothetical protein
MLCYAIAHENLSLKFFTYNPKPGKNLILLAMHWLLREETLIKIHFYTVCPCRILSWFSSLTRSNKVGPIRTFF